MNSIPTLNPKTSKLIFFARFTSSLFLSIFILNIFIMFYKYNGASPDCFWLYWSNYRFYLIIGIILSINLKKILSLFSFYRRKAESLKHSSNIVANNQTYYPTNQIIDFLEFLGTLGLIFLFFISIRYIVRSNYNPFIYFNF